MTVPDRAGLARGLAAALAAPEPAQRVNELLRGVLTTDTVAWESDEQRLVRSVSERVDAASGDTTRLLKLAQNVQLLLHDASSSGTVELLLEVIAERERVLDVTRKYVEGTITRTGFLSFVAEQRWPERVRRRLSELPPADIATLTAALQGGDITRLEALLLG